ncbi:transglutaminase TgpA family protein [Metabacillus fastidiosus]|uniref:transglutaminase TgpA family protein n=1 Tax=Metabacillus fastidiosus TaxID=1458 RepID=UPI002DBA6CD1|nr:transglutaminaseTgpA domain-containing protein [Metabacillus fastidiosus]MEC2075138.1 transglutaminaseTgpA domain-containing protein [Metabacillus fastidiosus]
MRFKEQNPIAFIYYFFAFLLLSEWLSPLQKFTDTANTYIFMLFIGVSFLLTFLRIKWFIVFPINISIILYFLYDIYYKDHFSGSSWIGQLLEEIVRNTDLIRHTMWNDMTSPFRTMLFFILLWLLVYLIHYWIVYQRKILFFFLITIIYITVLDTFTPYDATFAIIRIVLIGFFMIGLLSFDRLKEMERLKVGRFVSFRWILPLFFFIASSIVIGLLAPKSAPQWPDPVPYFKAYGQNIENNNISGVKKIGYGTNDEKLGGAFVADNTEVFRHMSEDRHYWRVETKDVYTGKGWEVSDSDADEINLADINYNMDWIEDGVKKEKFSSTVKINKSYSHSHIIYPFQLKNISTNSSVSYYINPTTELITAKLDGREQQLSEYLVDYEIPRYDVKELEQVTQSGNERYTQLPDSLPDRVKKLAESLTADKHDQFSKVKAIENFLGSSEFKYETEDVAVPKGNEDYVDQFLFETMQGYCDNFSTSMIVLLRSVDIPARWVKGYTEGEFQQIPEGNLKQYTVTNNNAHSWVEVYFDGIGWVTFEPTKGFSNPYDFTYNSERTNVTGEEEKKEEPSKQEQSQENEEKDSSENKSLQLFSIRFGNLILYISIILIGVFVLICYKKRRIWLSKIIISKYKKRRDDEVFFKAYNALLKQLERSGLKRNKGQTLREYAIIVDHYFNNDDMTKLTANYERTLYHHASVKDTWDESAEIWENLIKRTAS